MLLKSITVTMIKYIYGSSDNDEYVPSAIIEGNGLSRYKNAESMEKLNSDANVSDSADVVDVLPKVPEESVVDELEEIVKDQEYELSQEDLVPKIHHAPTPRPRTTKIAQTKRKNDVLSVISELQIFLEGQLASHNDMVKHSRYGNLFKLYDGNNKLVFDYEVVSDSNDAFVKNLNEMIEQGKETRKIHYLNETMKKLEEMVKLL